MVTTPELLLKPRPSPILAGQKRAAPETQVPNHRAGLSPSNSRRVDDPDCTSGTMLIESQATLGTSRMIKRRRPNRREQQPLARRSTTLQTVSGINYVRRDAKAMKDRAENCIDQLTTGSLLASTTLSKRQCPRPKEIAQLAHVLDGGEFDLSKAAPLVANSSSPALMSSRDGAAERFYNFERVCSPVTTTQVLFPGPSLSTTPIIDLTWIKDESEKEKGDAKQVAVVSEVPKASQTNDQSLGPCSTCAKYAVNSPDEKTNISLIPRLSQVRLFIVDSRPKSTIQERRREINLVTMPLSVIVERVARGLRIYEYQSLRFTLKTPKVDRVYKFCKDDKATFEEMKMDFEGYLKEADVDQIPEVHIELLP